MQLRPQAGITPNRDIFRSAATADRFTAVYHSFLSTLEAETHNQRTLAVLPAVPLAAAVAMGRGVMRDTHPTLRVYDRDEYNVFVLAATVNA